MRKALSSDAIWIIPTQDFISKEKADFAAFHFGDKSPGSLSRSVNGANYTTNEPKY